MRLRVLVLIFGMFAQIASADDSFTSLISRHCVDCHDDSTTEGELDLVMSLSGAVSDESKARVLDRMIARVSAKEMPPDGSDSLEGDERKLLLRHSRQELNRLADQLRDDPATVAMPRLTPYEYRNVMRDLSGGIVTGGGRLLPNEGGAGEGFANVGTAQVMTMPQYEKYIDAAKDALQHLRVYPTRDSQRAAGAVWRPYPRPAVDVPAAARKEVVDEIIAWFVAQQQKWGAEHRNDLEQQLGFVHAAYLEAAWHYSHRVTGSADIASRAWVSNRRPSADRIALAPAALKKWWHILNSNDKSSPHATWAAAWRQLAEQSNLGPTEVRERCIAIVAGNEKIVVETEDYAPPYEISFHEAKEEVLEAAEKKGHWPFRIEVGEAKELFLVVTDAGDGRTGEYAIWRRGRFVFRDGSSKPWQEVVTILGARSGNEYPFGYDGEKSKVLSADAVGAKPPGALKFAVPNDAIVFEVDLTLDENRTKLASIQALVLKERPKSSSYIPGRFVFGGKKRPVTAGAKLKQEQERALRKRNVSEANKTKIGLNAERNIFASWDRTPLESIGGPWPDQDPDKYEPNFPYHYTVEEIHQNATGQDVAELVRLEERLASLVDGRDESHLLSQAEEFILPFARRAWRREVTKSELNALRRLYRNAREQGLSFDSSVKTSLLLVLSSPHFIYKSYPAAVSTNEPTVPLSSHALATRLSFFIWGSLPDQQLLDLADRDELQQPEMLTHQAHRMLQDQRARSLASDFAGQLWDFSDFGTFDNPDRQRFPDFTSELRTAMVTEVETFLADIFQNDRSLTNILDANYTFANAILAKHYGLAGENSNSTFQRIGLPEERGGLATMGLFLTKKSLPLRTSPVQRGVWVMESLLGMHLPNPPADVPALSEDDKNTSGENIRQQLERHRADASCASCHDKIDPLGISLENFDAIGRWRDTLRDGSALTTAATTHDGVRLDGSASLKTYLVAHRGEFINHFNRKLLGYALGRSVHIGDRALLARMRKRLETEAFRFSVLVDEIVSSPQFRMKRIEHE